MSRKLMMIIYGIGTFANAASMIMAAYDDNYTKALFFLIGAILTQLAFYAAKEEK